MTPRALPRNPNLKLINDQARHFLQDFRQGKPLALTHYSLFDSLPDTPNPRLADAPQDCARERLCELAKWLNLHVPSVARTPEPTLITRRSRDMD